MEPLQRRDKVVHTGHAGALPTQPADELEAQLCREAAQVTEAHLLQEVAGVAPQHHVDVHVLRTLRLPAGEGGREEREKERGREEREGYYYNCMRESSPFALFKSSFLRFHLKWRMRPGWGGVLLRAASTPVL